MEAQLIDAKRLYITAKHESLLSVELNLIPHFCGAVVACNWQKSWGSSVTDGKVASEFFIQIEKAAQVINRHAFGGDHIPPIVFYDVSYGVGWQLASAIGLKPLQTWDNPNSGNAVGLFMYHPQGD